MDKIFLLLSNNILNINFPVMKKRISGKEMEFGKTASQIELATLTKKSDLKTKMSG